MTDDYYGSTYYFVVLRKCDRNNKKQSWECSGVNNMYIRQTKSYRHLDYGEFHDYVTIRLSRPDVAKWRRYDTQESVCSRGNLKNQCTIKFTDKTKLLNNESDYSHFDDNCYFINTSSEHETGYSTRECRLHNPKFRRYRGLKN